VLFVVFKVYVVVVLFSEIVVAVEANILANVDTYQKIFAWHISREHKVFIDLINELRLLCLL